MQVGSSPMSALSSSAALRPKAGENPSRLRRSAQRTRVCGRVRSSGEGDLCPVEVGRLPHPKAITQQESTMA